MTDDSRSPSDEGEPRAEPNSLEAALADSVSREDFAVFAHELRGALTVISGYSDMLRRPLHEDERLAALEGIRRAVGRADVLCTEVLSGRPVGASAASPREPVELWALAEHVASEQRAATGRAIIVEAPGDVSVIGDEQALSRVLTNLVANAAKYSPPETIVKIRAFNEYTTQHGVSAVLEVSDRGSGIADDDRQRIFEPFERLGRGDEIPGTGLGLAIVFDVVRAHGGSIEIRDHLGGGTTMRVELPIAN
jgi:two-component system OmpR family sensor kinase